MACTCSSASSPIHVAGTTEPFGTQPVRSTDAPTPGPRENGCRRGDSRSCSRTNPHWTAWTRSCGATDGPLQQARELLDAAGTRSDEVAYQRLLLARGAAQARIGETEDGARVLREVNTWATEHGEEELLARSHRLLSSLFRRIGDP